MQNKAVELKSPFKNTDDAVKTEALQDVKDDSTFMKITEFRRQAVMNMMDLSARNTDYSSREHVTLRPSEFSRRNNSEMREGFSNLSLGKDTLPDIGQNRSHLSIK